MSEMVDRVAEAISLWDGNDWNGQLGGRKCVRDRYRDMARAAIEAMREPTKEIIDAHHVVPDDNNFEDRVADNWRNLIDTILVTEPAE